MKEDPHSIYDFSAALLASVGTETAAPSPLVARMEVQPLSLGEFRGRVLLIVNTASRCGFTPQYAGLETLYRTYRQRGFEVLGFPCNQFGGQEPGTSAEVSAFCEENYGITFPLFAKIDVNGTNAHPLYRFLRQQKRGILGPLGSGAIRWNFTKFLVDRKGTVVARFGPAKEPKALAGAIERLVDETLGEE